ncbi:MAG: hypothetical protein M3Z21_05030, partial [Pseudomonadota bacterium]|nr:hypothetical protein [Pseudomonadota bacterium]
VNSIERRNTYAVPSGSVSQLALSTPWLRKTARVLIPYRTRRFVRNRLLFKPAVKPAIDSQSKDMLINYYSDDVKALKRLLPNFPWHRWIYWQDTQPH